MKGLNFEFLYGGPKARIASQKKSRSSQVNSPFGGLAQDSTKVNCVPKAGVAVEVLTVHVRLVASLHW
jgi:hypothetical protein